MKKTIDSVQYVTCTITKPLRVQCFGGPFDGEWMTITPGEGCDDLYAVWDKYDRACEIYRTAWRFTTKHGNEGIVLVWYPQAEFQP